MARAICARCERPASVCLCASLPAPVSTATELLILQHPAEAGHAKNTATLLRLGLSRCRLLRGEHFDPAAWTGPRQAWLLYPGAETEPSAPAPAERLLILLDGSWRQSRRLLHLNPALAALPRLALPPGPGGRYALRRAHRPGQLSTLEAGLLALQQMEGDEARFRPLWQAFDAFVAAGLQRAGRCPAPGLPGVPVVP